MKQVMLMMTLPSEAFIAMGVVCAFFGFFPKYMFTADFSSGSIFMFEWSLAMFAIGGFFAYLRHLKPAATGGTA